MLARINTINKSFTVTMAAEVLPSLSLQNGQSIIGISKENRSRQLKIERSLHKRIERNMFTEDGNDFAFQKVGLKVCGRVTAPSSYKGHIGYVEQIESIHSSNELKLLIVAAAIKGYVQDQNAVTLRSFIPSKAHINDVWAINCNRIITSYEMFKIRDVLLMNGIQPDKDVALVSSKYGIDILDIDGIKNSVFRRIPKLISKVLNGVAIPFKNRFSTEELHNGYIGGDDFESAQIKYKEIINEFNNEISFRNNSHISISNLIDLKDLDIKREENRNITRTFINENTQIERSCNMNHQFTSFLGGAA